MAGYGVGSDWHIQQFQQCFLLNFGQRNALRKLDKHIPLNVDNPPICIELHYFDFLQAAKNFQRGLGFRLMN